jgi:hypothetical protein
MTVQRLDERDSVFVAEGVDGFVHAYRETDDAVVAKLSICGQVAMKAPAKDHQRMCRNCGVWMLRWAGSKDPEGEFEALGPAVYRPDDP